MECFGADSLGATSDVARHPENMDVEMCMKEQRYIL